MNSAIRSCLSCVLISWGFQALPAQDATPLFISQGTEVSAQKLLLSLDGLSLVDKGNLKQDSSTFRFHSPLQDQSQSISTSSTFYRLELALEGTSLKLESDLLIDEELEMESGLLNLNAHSLFLEGENARISGENEQHRITGSGLIEKQTYLSFPHMQRPGNMGVEISAEAELGMSTLRRIHKPFSQDSLSLIERQYELIPAMQADVPISLSLDYYQVESPFVQGEALIPLQQKNQVYGKLNYYTDRPFRNKMELILPPVQKDWQIALSHEKETRRRGPQLLEIGPNPFHNRLEVNWSNRDDRAIGIKLYASGGVLVYQQALSDYGTSIKLENLGELAAGMYVLKIETDAGMILSQNLLKASAE